MRPRQHSTTGSAGLFRARLDQIINMKCELVQLAGKPDRTWICRAILMAVTPCGPQSRTPRGSPAERSSAHGV